MMEVAVVNDPDVAEDSPHPVRSRLLAELTGRSGLPLPASATSLAAWVRLPRQRVGCHLTELRRHGLVELESERRRGNVMEQRLRATVSAYAISPLALASLAPDPARSGDRLSVTWLLAIAARLLRDAGSPATVEATRMWDRHDVDPSDGATFGIASDVRFASRTTRVAFAAELVAVEGDLLARHHAERAAVGRDYRLVIALHPRGDASATDDQPVRPEGDA